MKIWGDSRICHRSGHYKVFHISCHRSLTSPVIGNYVTRMMTIVKKIIVETKVNLIEYSLLLRVGLHTMNNMLNSDHIGHMMEAQSQQWIYQNMEHENLTEMCI